MAQELVFQAYEANPTQARKLIKKALKLDPDNADAYNCLGELADDAAEAARYYLQGLDAGMRAIGEKGFKEMKGHFWGFHETRPFMRAKEGLALALMEMGESEEAIKHMQEMLELNPNDNQGVRYYLMVLLILVNRVSEVKKLHKRYKDDASANWLYNHAFFLFRSEGDSPKAKRALKEAYQFNPHFLDLLTSETFFDEDIPSVYSPGSREEALIYLSESAEIWAGFEPALKWVLEFKISQQGGKPNMRLQK